MTCWRFSTELSAGIGHRRNIVLLLLNKNIVLLLLNKNIVLLLLNKLILILSGFIFVFTRYN